LCTLKTGFNLTQMIRDENRALNELMIFLLINEQEYCVAIREAKTTIVENVSLCIDLRETEIKKKVQKLEGSNRKKDTTMTVLLTRWRN
jgi:hypothetical protein